MDSNITRGEYLKAAEIMAACGSKYTECVLHFLDKAGMCDAEFWDIIESEPKIKHEPVSRGRKKIIDPEFVALLKEAYDMRDDHSFPQLLKYLRTKYGVQSSRFYEWMNGERGVTDKLKEAVAVEMRAYIDGKQKSPKLAEQLKRISGTQSEENSIL